MHTGTGKPKNTWYNESRYAVFWQHYNGVMQAAHQNALLKAHGVAAQTRASLSNMQRHTVRGQPFVPSKCRSGRTSRKSRRWRHKMSKKKHMGQESFSQRGSLSDTESLFSKMSQGMHIQDPDGEGDEDMEVSDDFLDFLEASQKHREEYKVWKAKQQKQERGESDSGVTLNAGAASLDTTPKEHPDVIRSREMQQLYGEAAPRIHAMETALQLSFDRISTLHRPQYWPNIPFSVIYANEF